MRTTIDTEPFGEFWMLVDNPQVAPMGFSSDEAAATCASSCHEIAYFTFLGIADATVPAYDMCRRPDRLSGSCILVLAQIVTRTSQNSQLTRHQDSSEELIRQNLKVT